MAMTSSVESVNVAMLLLCSVFASFERLIAIKSRTVLPRAERGLCQKLEGSELGYSARTDLT